MKTVVKIPTFRTGEEEEDGTMVNAHLPLLDFIDCCEMLHVMSRVRQARWRLMRSALIPVIKATETRCV